MLITNLLSGWGKTAGASISSSAEWVDRHSMRASTLDLDHLSRTAFPCFFAVEVLSLSHASGVVVIKQVCGLRHKLVYCSCQISVCASFLLCQNLYRLVPNSEPAWFNFYYSGFSLHIIYMSSKNLSPPTPYHSTANTSL